MKKKAQVFQNIGALGIGIAVLTITLVITFLIIANTKEQGISQESSNLLVRVNNETVESFTIDSFAALTNNGRSKLNCIEVLNATNNGSNVIPTTDYSCTAAFGILLSNTTGAVDSSVNVTYEYSEGDLAFNSSESLQNATATVPGWIPLIVLVIFGGIILMMIRRFREEK